MPLITPRPHGRPRRAVACLAAACALASLGLGSGCAARREVAPRLVDGVAYGTTAQPFRQRWWQFYERGLSWARGGFLAEAEADFRDCLQLRQSDARRARTYGMHFVQCFVHRELGAVLLAAGRLDEAERELRTSLGQEPSAKAELLLRRIDQRRARAAPAPAAIAVLGAAAPAAVGAPAAPPEPPGRIEIESIGPAAAAAAPAADGVEVRGRLRDAGAMPLWSVAADGTAQRVETAADGGFALRMAAAGSLRAGDDPANARISVTPAHPPAAPTLALDGPDGGQVVSGGRAWYRYDAAAQDGLAELEISASAWPAPKRLPLAGVRSVGVVPVDIAAGLQHVRFTLRSRAGVPASAERTVVVQPRPDQDRELRATALVIPLQRAWPAAAQAPDDPLLVGALAADGRFRLLDRGDDPVLAGELALVEAGYVDRATAAEAGRKLASRYVIAGTLGRGHDDIECFARLIQADSGRLVCTADAYADGLAGEQVERDFFAAVAGRLRQRFPVVEGRTVVEDGDIALDVGARHGVVTAMRFHVLAPSGEAGTIARPEATIEAVDCGQERTRARLVSGPACPAGRRVISE